MSQCVVITSQGFLKTANNEHCSSFVIVSHSEYSQLNSHKSVSAQDAAIAIGFGFSVVFGLGYLTTYAVAVAKRVIKLI